MKKFIPIMLFFSLLWICWSEAHDVSGKVEVILKNEKKKTDLSSVILYLNQPGTVNMIPLRKPSEIATQNKQFAPRAMAIPAGATITFPNNDPIFHNIFSVSPKFDLGLSKAGETKKYTFQSPGIAKIFCNVHPEMSATIVVSGTPYFTNANASGSYILHDVPAGTYLLRAYTEEGQTEKKIEVGGTPLNVDVTIDGRSYKKASHKNKFGKDYSTDEDERY
jgi:plastocyanin